MIRSLRVSKQLVFNLPERVVCNETLFKDVALRMKIKQAVKVGRRSFLSNVTANRRSIDWNRPFPSD